ncbi:unnamed protein product [Caenorhabditis auriculariae]|uniref:CRAL-TRIO domain-containing protein n=1 Tax=Caenorhabditis auriculariae TaxID=2777116 RepID=A0A8S1GXQ4_9PELO|nr:unnamed protein product [Caenorhabditis auriculariae]
MAVQPETSSSAVESPNEHEKLQIDELRRRLSQALPRGIPNDLDTDLNLSRWIRGYHADFDKIEKNFRSYVSSREAAGFVGDDFPEKFFERNDIAPFLKFIASSRLQDRQWSEAHNSFLFVEKAWSQPRDFIKTFKTSDYLLHCFGYSEMLLQLILRREKKQPLEKGPVQFIVLFDLACINITDYVNPMSGYMKLWQLRSELWQDWYPEMVHRIYLVNPPRLVSLLWKCARLFLSEQNLKRMEIVGNMADLSTKHLPKWFVPKAYGGDFVNTVPPGDEAGVSIREKITAVDHYRPYQHYKKRGVERPKSSHKDISPGETFIVPIQVPEGKSLLWDFTVSGEVHFHIQRGKQEDDMVYPQLHLVTNKLNEEGELEKLKEDEYSFCFTNHSSYFTLKLEYSIAIV